MSSSSCALCFGCALCHTQMNPETLLNTVPSEILPNDAKMILKRKGIVKIKDVLKFRSKEIAMESECMDLKGASRLLRYCKGNSVGPIVEEKWDQMEALVCDQLKCLFPKGIPLGSFIEICGMPGMGKTKFCLQLCMQVQLPRQFGGLSGEALYIDTDRSLYNHPSVSDMAEYYLESTKGQSCLTREQLLNGVGVFPVNDHYQELAAIRSIQNRILFNPKIKLVIVDSIAMLFKQKEKVNNHKLIYNIATSLKEIAKKFNIIVIVTNQVTTEISNSDNVIQKSQRQIPALGVTWSHAISNRLMMLNKNRNRILQLHKSTIAHSNSMPYFISPLGIFHDIKVDSTNQEPPLKRPKTTP